MMAWLDYWNFFFWVIFLLLFFVGSNFLSLMLYSELIWICLYIISVILGALSDNLMLYSMSFYLLAFAGVEFSLGFLIALYFFLLKKNITEL